MANVYVPSLLFQTHLAVPTSFWQLVQLVEGCAAVSQLIVVTAAAGRSGDGEGAHRRADG